LRIQFTRATNSFGLEDYQYGNDGQLTNRQIVERAAAAIRAMGHEVATPDEARKILQV